MIRCKASRWNLWSWKKYSYWLLDTYLREVAQIRLEVSTSKRIYDQRFGLAVMFEDVSNAKSVNGVNNVVAYPAIFGYHDLHFLLTIIPVPLPAGATAGFIDFCLLYSISSPPVI